MKARPLGSLGAVILAYCSLLLATVPGLAQNTPNSYSERLSRVELYGEYSYLHPVSANIFGPEAPALPTGGIAGINYYFTRHIGIEAEAGYHQQDSSYHCMFTGQAGVVGRTQLRRFVPFVHALGGESKLAGPDVQPCKAGWGLTGGVGVDYILPGLGGHIALRPIQADYEYNHIDYGPAGAPHSGMGGLLKENAYRLSAGVVFRLGNMDGSGKEPTSMSCDANPGDVFPGEPVTVSARTLDTKSKNLSYSWATSGGQIAGHGGTVQIDTNGLAPGNYLVSGRMTRGARGKFAECNARFAIRDRNARTIVLEQPSAAPAPAAKTDPTASNAVSCSAAPAAILPAGTATIAVYVPAAVVRPLTYTYSASAGIITGNGSTATFSAPGMAGGTTVTITCNVADPQGGTAVATTTITILTPEVSAEPQTNALCTLSFDRDRARPARVDNAAKACLDDIALTLQRDPANTLDMAGSYGPGERPIVGSQRAVNAKLYLTREKGIDRSRIQVRNEGAQGRIVQNTLIPAGMAGDPGNFDERRISTPYQAYAVAGSRVVTRRTATRRRTVRRAAPTAPRPTPPRAARRRVTPRPAVRRRPAPQPSREPVPDIITPVFPSRNSRLRDYVPPVPNNVPLPYGTTPVTPIQPAR